MFLKIKRLHSYKLVKFANKKMLRHFGFEATFFATLFSESLLSERPGFDSRPAQSLRGYIFATLWPKGPKISSFKRSNLF